MKRLTLGEFELELPDEWTATQQGPNGLNARRGDTDLTVEVSTPREPSAAALDRLYEATVKSKEKLARSKPVTTRAEVPGRLFVLVQSPDDGQQLYAQLIVRGKTALATLAFEAPNVPDRVRELDALRASAERGGALSVTPA